MDVTEELLDDSDRNEIQHQIRLCSEQDTPVVCTGQCQDDIENGDETFSKLQIDYSEPLYNTSKIPKIQFIVPTSQMNWEHDACPAKPGSVQDLISKWCNNNAEKYSNCGQGQSMVCNVTSLPKDIMDIDVMKDRKNNVLLLPHFLWINNLTSENVDRMLDDVVPSLLDNTVDRLALLREKPYLSEARESSFVFICSHMTRDKRCGIIAPILKKTFDKELTSYGLYRDNSDLRSDGVNVQYINHIGGHKFAANIQIYIKRSSTLVWLGRVKPSNIPILVKTLLVPEVPMLPFPEKVRCLKNYQTW